MRLFFCRVGDVGQTKTHIYLTLRPASLAESTGASGDGLKVIVFNIILATPVDQVPTICTHCLSDELLIKTQQNIGFCWTKATDLL